MASNLRKIGNLRLLSEVGGLLCSEGVAQRWRCLSTTTAAAAAAACGTGAMHAPNAPHQIRQFCALSPMHAAHGVNMATAKQSMNELLGKIEEESKIQSGQGAELASVLRQFDGAAVLFQTGVLGDLDRPLAKQVLARIAPTLRSTAHTLTLQQATNVLSTVALLSCFDVKLIAAVVEKAVPEIPSAQPKTIAALCYALGISGYSDHRLMRELEGVLEARQADFDMESFAKVVWMLGRAHHKSAAAFSLVDALAERALREDAAPRDVVYAMWACGQHRAHMDELADQAHNVVAGRLDELSGADLAKLACGLVEAEVREESLFEDIAKTGAKLMHAMCPRDIAKLMYFLGRVQVGDREFVAAAKPHVLANLDNFTYNELDMIVQAYNAWGMHDETSSAIARRMSKDRKYRPSNAVSGRYQDVRGGTKRKSQAGDIISDVKICKLPLWQASSPCVILPEAELVVGY